MALNDNSLFIYLIAGGFTAIVGAVAVIAYLHIKANSSKVAYEEQLEDLLQDENDPNLTTKVPLTVRWNKYWSEITKESGLPKYNEPDNNAGRDVVFIAIILAVLVSVLAKNIFAGPGVAVVLVFGLSLILKSLAGKKAEAINGQLPGFLFALKANVQANETPERAILKVIDGMPSPLYDELLLVKRRLMANSTFKEALEELQYRTASRDLKFLCACMIQASGAGANLEKQIITIQKVIEARSEVSDELTQAVKKVSPTMWIASVIIPGIFLFRYVTDATAREFWFIHPYSWLAVIAAGVFWIAGILMSKRFVDKIKNL